jgi:hypothetical protein
MIVVATLFFTLVSIVTVLKHTSDELKSRVDNLDFRRVFKSENKKKKIFTFNNNNDNIFFIQKICNSFTTEMTLNACLCA